MLESSEYIKRLKEANVVIAHATCYHLKDAIEWANEKDVEYDNHGDPWTDAEIIAEYLTKGEE